MTGRLRVLVTNDDGVDAPGIDAIATALAADPAVAVTIVAPATNQTGASSTITTGPVDVVATPTASGHPATAVGGTPSDAALVAIRTLCATPPDLVVSGLNAGPNLAELIAMSGTVAAALTAARLGVPAIAASLGLATSMDYAPLAAFVRRLVDRFRTDDAFRRRLREPTPVVLNVNFPSCPHGPVRGIRVVPLGRLVDVTGYYRDGRRFTPTIRMGDVTVSDCQSTFVPTTDLEAFNHGFASVTPLAPDLTMRPTLDDFGDLAT